MAAKSSVRPSWRISQATVAGSSSSRVDLGKRIDISADGFVVGARGSEFEVEGAQESRLRIQWADPVVGERENSNRALPRERAPTARH